MMSFDTIAGYMRGSGEAMLGNKAGLSRLDISADGFWESFMAIPVAVPALLLSWVGYAQFLVADGGVSGSVPSIVVRIALVDLAAWIIPVAAVMVLAKPLAIGGRLAHYVIASNWASALVAWALAPFSLLQLLVSGQLAVFDVIDLALFLAVLFLMYRLTLVTLSRPPLFTFGFFAGVLVLSIVTIVVFKELLGLTPAA